MRRCIWLVLVAIGFVPARAEALKVRFIGNEAFEITDGKVTILTDFPYHSGAFGYMKYRLDEINPPGKVLCLITHRHEDHFDYGQFKKTNWLVAGPTGKIRGVDPARIVPLGKAVNFEGVEIRPLPTPHADLEHYSYWVRWHGVKLYFPGDTEELGALLGVGKLDVLFISPWLLESLLAMGEPAGIGKVVVYHHRADEKVRTCERCLVPKQG